jgi:hypothetical protein
LKFANIKDMPIDSELASDNFYQIGLIGNSTALSSSGLRKALTSVGKGGYQYVFTTLEAYSNKWTKYIGLPADFYRERKFLIAGSGPRNIPPKPAPRLPNMKTRADEPKEKVLQLTFVCLTVAIGSLSGTSGKFVSESDYGGLFARYATGTL